jgi:phospholipid/cholesterol/gamma-HCH transport system substrate-binding protein
MRKYRGEHLLQNGLIGLVLAVLVIAVGLNPDGLAALATRVNYQALFTEAGGLTVGDKVVLSGLNVGSVEDVSLRKGKAVVTFTVDATVVLGADTTAHIRTGSLLGQRVLTLEGKGTGSLRPGDVIPTTRTSSPYSLAEAVNELTTNTAQTDTQSLNASLDALSSTIDQISPQLGPTFDGLTRLSQSLNGRNDSLRQLLTRAGDVTGILAQRSDQINALLLNANDLIGVLNDRHQAIVDLLTNTSVVARQLTGLVNDNEKQLAPALEKLNSVTAVLEKNRDNLAKALPGLAKFELTQGETVANGYYYNAYVPNLAPAQFFQPFLDYAFGFRRGVDMGQPPDNAGPRAEFPIPYNGTPGGSR